MSFELTGLEIERNHRTGVKIVPWPLVAHPGPAVSRAPEAELGFRIIGAGDPDRATAGFPLVSVRPGLAPGLARPRHRVRLPECLPALGIKRGDKAADPKLAARTPDHPPAVHHEGRERHIITLGIV